MPEMLTPTSAIMGAGLGKVCSLLFIFFIFYVHLTITYTNPFSRKLVARHKKNPFSPFLYMYTKLNWVKATLCKVGNVEMLVNKSLSLSTHK